MYGRLSGLTKEMALPKWLLSFTMTSRPSLATASLPYSGSAWSFRVSFAGSVTIQTTASVSRRSVRSLLMFAPNASPTTVFRSVGSWKPRPLRRRERLSCGP